MIYRCRVLGGTGTASDWFPDLVDRWADRAGYRDFIPGSLNLGADRAVEDPTDFISLQTWQHLCIRQGQEHLSPRLHEVRLNGTQPAWVFRWCAPEHVYDFVGHADGCPPERRLEVVADVRLKTVLALEVGSPVDLEFLR